MARSSTGVATPTAGKRPSFQFYPNDWRTDAALRMCSVPARGLWIEMLCIMHQGTPYGYLRINDKDLTAQMLATLVGAGVTEAQGWLKDLETLGVFQRDENDSIYSKRMVHDEQIRDKRASFGGLSQNNPNVPKRKEGAKDTSKDTLTTTFGGSPSSSSSSSTTTTKKHKHPAPDVAGVVPITRTTWLVPYANAWQEIMGGPVQIGVATKVLSGLHKQHGEAKVVAHLKNYLGATDARFVSLPKFGSTFGQWSNTEAAVRASGKDCNISDAEVEYMLRIAKAANDPWAQ